MRKISEMCNVKLGPKLGLVGIVTVLLIVVSIYFVKNFNDEKDKEERKRLIMTEMKVTTQQTHFHTEPIINVTAIPRENLLVFPVELPMYGRRIVNSTDIRNRIIEDDVYINDISIRSEITTEFNIGLGKVSGWFEAGEKHLLELTSRRLTIGITPTMNLTIPRNRIEDMRRFRLLDQLHGYYRVRLNSAYIYPDETVEYLLRLLEYDRLDSTDAEWEDFLRNNTMVMTSQLTDKQKAERIENLQLGCHFDYDQTVQSDFTLSKSISGTVDLIETFIYCDLNHSKNAYFVTNGESVFRFPVPFAPFVLAQERHWTTGEIGFSHKTNSMFVNGLYARHVTRWRSGDNLIAQLVKLFPSCQFAAFEFETVLKRPIEGIDDKHKAGILASNCTQVELNSKSNSTLEFAIDETRLRDLRQLNMSHCFEAERTVGDFLPSIQPVGNWPDTEFTGQSLIYNQLDLPRLIDQSYCHQT